MIQGVAEVQRSNRTVPIELERKEEVKTQKDFPQTIQKPPI